MTQKLNQVQIIESEICDELSTLPSTTSINGVPMVAFDSVIQIIEQSFKKFKVSSHKTNLQGANSGQLQQHSVMGSVCQCETPDPYFK